MIVEIDGDAGVVEVHAIESLDGHDGLYKIRHRLRHMRKVDDPVARSMQQARSG